MELLKRNGQHSECERRAHRNHDGPLGSVADGGDLLSCTAHVRQKQAHTRRERLAVLGELNALDTALHQRCTHLALELPNNLCYRRLGNSERSCRRTDAQLLGHRSECMKLVGFHESALQNSPGRTGAPGSTHMETRYC
ncbi:hypothetical protein D9M72_522030 [compost metagenome]